MFPDDLAPAPAAIGEIHSTAAFIPPSLETSSLVSAFLDGAVRDTLDRTHGTRLEGHFETVLSRWIRTEKLDSIILSRPAVGPVRDFLQSQQLPITPHPFIRTWDRRLWPQASVGFFKFKTILPKIHASLAPLRTNNNSPHS